MEQNTENKMGTKPVWSLLLTMAVPVILSTAAQSLYNIVDGIFVSMLGEDAMAAITFAGPCTTVLIALGTGVAVGMNTMLSHGLGEKNQEHTDSAAAAAVFLSIAGGLLSLLAAFTLVRPYLSLQTSSPPFWREARPISPSIWGWVSAPLASWSSSACSSPPAKPFTT